MSQSRCELDQALIRLGMGERLTDRDKELLHQLRVTLIGYFTDPEEEARLDSFGEQTWKHSKQSSPT